MKILFVANYSNTTGYAWSNIYRLFLYLARELTKYDVECFASFSTINPPLEFPHFSNNVLQFDPHGTGLSNTIKLLLFVRDNEIDGVYFTDQPSFRSLYFLLRCVGVKKIVVHCRVSVADPKPAKEERGPRGLAKALLHRVPFFNVDKIYAVSDFVRNRLILKARVPGSKVERILNGIDTAAFRPQWPYKWSSCVNIFICGRATPHKGIDILIKALANVEKEYAINVDYYGDGPYLEDYRCLVEKLGLSSRFTFKGAVPSTQSLLNKYDLACVPSSWGDACPSSVSEAMASGVPLIATRAGGIPELVGDEENALLVEPNDIEGLARAIQRMASSYDVRNSYSLNGRKRAEVALPLGVYYEEVLARFVFDFGVRTDLRLRIEQTTS